MTHSALLLFVDALACHRITHLVTTDRILQPLRDRLIGEIRHDQTGVGWPQHPRVAEFLHCAWCVSMWAAIPIVALQALAPAVCLPVTATLALSTVAGLISERN